jgi:CMP-N-acetylneuraminic acid synthetase
MGALAIIPARGGSRGIPRKNLRPLAGIPLIAHVIASARAVPALDRIVVSTEDAEIARVAAEAGAEVPFLRPSELAGDDVPTLPVLRHAVAQLEAGGYRPEIVVLLYTTSPLLTPGRIAEAIALIRDRGCDSSLSVVQDIGHFWTGEPGSRRRFYPETVVNRQQARPLFRENGAVYACTRTLLMEGGTLTGGTVGFVEMEPYESVDIDTPEDLDLAAWLLERRTHGTGTHR